MWMTIVMGVARALLATGSGILIQKGLADADTVNQGVGAAGALATIIMSIWSKINAAKK